MTSQLFKYSQAFSLGSFIRICKVADSWRILVEATMYYTATLPTYRCIYLSTDADTIFTWVKVKV